MPTPEAVDRIEPAILAEPPVEVSDAVADLVTAATVLGRALHPRTAANLADLVRVMNTHYSNLIEGHNTRPRDIERALAGDLDANEDSRNLQLEAAAHVHVQEAIDSQETLGTLPEPSSPDFIRWLHREFYKNATAAMLEVQGKPPSGLPHSADARTVTLVPGEWRSVPEHDNVVGRHVPPSSTRVTDFMRHFEDRYALEHLGTAAKIMAIPAAHHRFNYIHPFIDGNGRVSRLMSHAMCHKAGIGAHGLWSISRGLARGLTSGLEGRAEYKRMMAHTDAPRQGDRDGRGNLSEKALVEFTVWFLKVCLDQVKFMAEIFEIDALAKRLAVYVDRSELKRESARLLSEALVRGEIERGEASRITGLPERTARRVLNDTIATGLLASDTPKGKLSLRFPADALEILFPRLF